MEVKRVLADKYRKCDKIKAENIYNTDRMETNYWNYNREKLCKYKYTATLEKNYKR